MRQEVGRRAFVGTVIAGVPFFTEAALARPQSTGAAAHMHAADRVSEELLRQFRGAVTSLRETGKAEHARTIASILRLSAAHADALGLDATWKRALEQHLRRDGLQSIIGQDIDPQRWQAEVAFFGAPELQPPFVSAADREKGVNAILSPGIVASLQRAAADFDARAGGLARRTDHGDFTLVQYADCGGLNNMLSIIQWEIAIACGLAYIDGGAACAFLTGTYIGLQAMAWWYGC